MNRIILRRWPVTALVIALVCFPYAGDARPAPALPVYYQVVDLGVHPSTQGVWPWVQQITPGLARRAFHGMMPRMENRRGDWVKTYWVDTGRPACGLPMAEIFQHDQRTFLPNLPGLASCSAHAINDQGDIVGSSWGPGSWRNDLPETWHGTLPQDNATEVAVLWHQGRVYPLQERVPKDWPGRLSVGYAIDDAGEILASDARSLRGEHFYLLVPEQTGRGS
jgi:hypothetical protein